MCDLQDAEPTPRATAVGMTEFVDELVVAITNRRIYWYEHPRVQTSVHELLHSLRDQFRTRGIDRLELGVFENYLFHDRRPLLSASLSATRILEPLQALESGGLLFKAGVEEQDLRALIEFLGQRSFDRYDLREANAELRQNGCQHVQILPPYRGGGGRDGIVDIAADQLGGGLVKAGAGDPTKPALNLELPLNLYQGIVDLLQDTMVKITRGGHFSMDASRGFVESILKQLQESASTMLSICRYEQYDAYTFGHSIRVCFLALNFARNLTEDHDLLERVGLAALMHDVGKALVPFEVLHYKGLLDPDQRVEMDKHTAHGGRILLDLEESDPLAVSAAFGHHRTLDGGGYPRTIHQARQSAVTRVIKICDVYEALTAERPYKAGMKPSRAYRIMISMKSHFDPALLRQFIQVNGIYCTGGRVRLNTGEVARVRHQTAHLEQPIVVLEKSAEDEALAQEDRLQLDLSQPEQRGNYEVEEFLMETGV